ncbi:extracellular matrix protein FRAS1, partial [Trichonephila clavata]
MLASSTLPFNLLKCIFLTVPKYSPEDNTVSLDGDAWNSSCNLCQCQSKNVTCTKIACPVIDCSAVETLTHYDNCCPQCDHLKKPCFDGPVRYIHNDVWYSQLNCILHQCQNGVIIPFIIQCPSIACSQ